MKKLVHSVLAAVAVVTLSVAGASTAAASPTSGWSARWYATVGFENWWLDKDGDVRARAQAHSDHSSYDEVIFISDYKADGFGQVVYWRGDGKSGVCKNEQGNGTTSRCDFNIVEGHMYYWQLCAKDGSTILACAPEESTKA